MKKPDNYTGYGYNLRMKVAFVDTDKGVCLACRPSSIPVEIIINDKETVHTSSDDRSFVKKIGFVSSDEGKKIDEAEIAKAKEAGLIK